MDPRELVQCGAYRPETLRAMGEAFDQAWDSIVANYGEDPRDIRRGRFNLATAVLEVTKDGNQDSQALKEAALEYMVIGRDKQGRR